MPRRIRLPVIKDGKALLKLTTPSRVRLIRLHLEYMPTCYNRLTEFGLWCEVPAELALDFVSRYDGIETSFWHRDLRVIDNWTDDETQIERWKDASD